MASLTQVDVLCQSDSVLVVWDGSGSDEYMATAEDGQGGRLNCSSTNSSCEISGLSCGQLYSFTVTGSQCESQPSNTIQRYSGKAPGWIGRAGISGKMFQKVLECSID